MTERVELPAEMGDGFPVWLARAHGVTRGRLRSPDLDAPFYGMRMSADSAESWPTDDDPYERQRLSRVIWARAYAPRLHTGHFFSHQTAASIWGAPLPLEFTDAGVAAEREELDLHVSAIGAVPFPRAAGIVGHRTLSSMTSRRDHRGLRVSSPAATWVSLGTLSVVDLVALGDYFCRRWRPGYGRRHLDRPPLATRDELQAALEAGRRRGAERLRKALEFIREDSWSPRESRVRFILVEAGLPEPELNVDVYDDDGTFIGCVDMAYPEQRVAVEYHGLLHGAGWARDVERAARLRAAGWRVIEVTSPLLKRPEELARRVRQALRR